MQIPSNSAAGHGVAWYAKKQREERLEAERKRQAALKRQKMIDEKWNEIHYACVAGYQSEVNKALKDNPNGVNARDVNGYTPLMIAASNGWYKVVRILLNAGADVTITDNQGRTCIWFTAMNQRVDILLLICRMNMWVVQKVINNPQKDKQSSYTVLSYASQQGYAKVVAALLTIPGIKINFENTWTPLYYATSNGHADAAVMLMKAGALLSGAKFSEIYAAAEKGHLHVLLRMKKEFSTRMDQSPSTHTTPSTQDFYLYRAINEFNNTAIRTLVSAGADVNLQITEGSRIFTPLSYMLTRKARNAANNKFETRTLEVMHAKGANLQFEEPNHASLLMLATKIDDNVFVPWLLAKGLDPNRGIEDPQSNEHGFTPWRRAIFRQDEAVIISFLQSGKLSTFDLEFGYLSAFTSCHIKSAILLKKFALVKNQIPEWIEKNKEHPYTKSLLQWYLTTERLKSSFIYWINEQFKKSKDANKWIYTTTLSDVGQASVQSFFSSLEQWRKDENKTAENILEKLEELLNQLEETSSFLKGPLGLNYNATYWFLSEFLKDLQWFLKEFKDISTVIANIINTSQPNHEAAAPKTFHDRIDFLKRYRRIELNLNELLALQVSINESDFLSILELISPTKPIESLKLNAPTPFSNEQLRSLFIKLKETSSLQKLSLADLKFDDEIAESLAQALVSWSKLENLSLDGLEISEPAFLNLSCKISAAENLVISKFTLRSMSMTPAVIEEFKPFFASQSMLTELDMSHTNPYPPTAPGFFSKPDNSDFISWINEISVLIGSAINLRKLVFWGNLNDKISLNQLKPLLDILKTKTCLVEFESDNRSVNSVVEIIIERNLRMEKAVETNDKLVIYNEYAKRLKLDPIQTLKIEGNRPEEVILTLPVFSTVEQTSSETEAKPESNALDESPTAHEKEKTKGKEIETDSSDESEVYYDPSQLKK